jgi:lysosomal Pro-X carboxypeptidase
MPNMSDKDMLHGLYQAVNLYYNYTGKTPCLNLSSEATQDLGTMGWDYQVDIRLVYPMLPISLDCPFFIASSVFSNVYLLYIETALINLIKI